MRKRKTLPLVEVYWLDATTYLRDFKLDEVFRDAVLTPRRTVGYYVGERTGITYVAHTFDPQDDGEMHVADVTVIPTGWVQDIKYLRGARRRPKAAVSDTVREQIVKDQEWTVPCKGRT